MNFNSNITAIWSITLYAHV